MIPPLQDLRIRSIKTWMETRTPPIPPAERNSRAQEMDSMMIEAFETGSNRLMDEMMRQGTWGTGDGMSEFQTGRLLLWEEVVNEFLEPTTGQPSEG